jgi:hypothetical protein
VQFPADSAPIFVWWLVIMSLYNLTRRFSIALLGGYFVALIGNLNGVIHGHVAGSPVILEVAVTVWYQWLGRVSVFTGLPDHL